MDGQPCSDIYSDIIFMYACKSRVYACSSYNCWQYYGIFLFAVHKPGRTKLITKISSENSQRWGWGQGWGELSTRHARDWHAHTYTYCIPFYICHAIPIFLQVSGHGRMANTEISDATVDRWPSPTCATVDATVDRHLCMYGWLQADSIHNTQYLPRFPFQLVTLPRWARVKTGQKLYIME